MDLTASFQTLNWLAILFAALSTFLIGGLWYSPLLFEKEWLISNDFKPEDLKRRNMPVTFGLTFLLSVIMALNLALFIGIEGVGYGITAGFFAGLGWVFMAIGIIALFEQRSLKYILINGGYMVVAFIVMGAILGAWK